MKGSEPNLPNPTQHKVLQWVDNVRATKEQDHIPVLYLQGGVGCIAEGQRVLMADGSYRAIEEVKIGDYVVSWNGKEFCSSKVSNSSFSGVKDVFSYKDSAGQTIECTSDHRIIHVGTQNRWKPISEMMRSYYGRSQVASISTHSQFRLSSIQQEEYLGERKTYDLEVENTQSFIVNGFIVHNSGKSRGILAPVMEMLFEIPGIRILWGRHDFKDLKLSIMDKFFEIMPPELISKKSEQYHWYDIVQNEGTFGRIYFNQLKDIGGLGSQEFGIIVVTEAHEIDLNVYRALKRRCRQENVINMILLESEPPNADHWLASVLDKNSEEYDPDIERWELTTYENWDNLPKSYTGSLETMPEAWKKKYLMGKCGFIPDGKPFYQGFRLDLHVSDFEWNEFKPLLCGWDFGFHHPALVITQVDDRGKWIVLRELMGFDITIDNFAEKCKSFLNLHYPDAECLHFGDPACTQVNDKSESTSWQILASKGILVKYRQSEYRARKEIIENKLGQLVSGKPTLMVDKKCTTIIDGFLGGYHYPLRRSEQEFVSKFEQPFKDGYYEHLMNALEYIAVNLFTAVKMKKVLKKKRKIKRLDNI